MTVRIKIWVRGRGAEGGEKVTEGTFTFVAIDQHGKPRALANADAKLTLLPREVLNADAVARSRVQAFANWATIQRRMISSKIVATRSASGPRVC